MLRSASSTGERCGHAPLCSVDIVWQCFPPMDQLEKTQNGGNVTTSKLPSNVLRCRAYWREHVTMSVLICSDNM